jgi:hypothetical protein
MGLTPFEAGAIPPGSLELLPGVGIPRDVFIPPGALDAPAPAPAPAPSPAPVLPAPLYQQEAYLFPVDVVPQAAPQQQPAAAPAAAPAAKNGVGIGTVAAVGLAALVVGALIWKD